MKKIINIIQITGLLIWMLSSCNLDKESPMNIRYEDAFKTMEDAAKFRNGLYTSLRYVQLGTYSYSHDLTSDLFNAVDGYGNNWGTAHRLDALMLTSGDVSGVWSNCYGHLKQVNHFLDRVDSVVTETSDDLRALAEYKAEAHYIRAYLYYQLIKHYGVDYEPADALNPTVSAPGVPLVKHYDTKERPSRATVGEIYGFVMEEIKLAEAGEWLPAGVQKSNRITMDAIKALKSKVQLCMHDYAGAATTAKALLNGKKYPLVTTAANLTAGWKDDNWSEDILLLTVSSAENDMSRNESYTRYSTATQTYTPYYLPSKKLVDMYETSDLRRTVYLSNPATETVVVQGQKHQGVQFVKKWPMTSMYTNNTYLHKPKVARIAEQYLIAAEAMLHINPAEAMAWLREFRIARGASVSDAALNMSNLESVLRDEWAREFCGEGMRLECLKRWHIGFNGREPQKAGIVVGAAEDNTLEYIKRNCPADYYRFTFPVPANDIRTNPNIIQTPEWVNPQ